MTFSIAGFCKKTGMFGTAISSSSISVASRCAFAKSKVGVVLTQNITNPDLGPLGLEQLELGNTPQQALDILRRSEQHIEYRQLGILDGKNESVVYSGANALGNVGEAIGDSCIAMGNLLDNTSVPQAMVDFFEANEQLSLPERLLLSLQAGVDNGGEAGPVKSAGLKVYGDQNWPIVDLRVDWNDLPIEELGTLLDVYSPQIKDYILRAESPDSAASYGVPGDE
ncbi:DUF1028 domain-containing protein [Vibrio sp. RC27]